MKTKKIMKFTTNKNVTKITVNNNWKNKIKNFMYEANWDKKNNYWYVNCKELKQKRYAPGKLYGTPNQQYYPSDSIIHKSKYGQNDIWIIYQQDIDLGMHFLKRIIKKDILKN